EDLPGVLVAQVDALALQVARLAEELDVGRARDPPAPDDLALAVLVGAVVVGGVLGREALVLGVVVAGLAARAAARVVALRAAAAPVRVEPPDVDAAVVVLLPGPAGRGDTRDARQRGEERGAADHDRPPRVQPVHETPRGSALGQGSRQSLTCP